jgi:glycosyltransferase involved in cell wall biosynthesis
MKSEKYKFSLVLATLGRRDTVDRFLETLLAQDYPLDLVEIIIVDQNKDGLLDNVVEKYSSRLDIKHVKSPTPGLSLNRNLGMDRATGEIIGFPDDDCEYPADLLGTVETAFQDTNADLLLGRIWDQKQGKPAIRPWPDKTIKLNTFNFYRLTSSITLFTKVRAQRFDERFGLGAQFGSNEDAIFVYSVLRSGSAGVYLPKIKVYHEDQPMSALTEEKVASYAAGFGKFAREYSSVSVLAIFFSSVLFQALHCVKAFALFDMKAAGLRATSLRSRVRGFF